jgi:hypothetical protein
MLLEPMAECPEPRAVMYGQILIVISRAKGSGFTGVIKTSVNCVGLKPAGSFARYGYRVPHQLRQLGDVGGDAPGFAVGEQLISECAYV